VQTLVNANGKNSSNVFFFPKLLLSFTSTRPEACLDLRLKSGALVPTGNGIGFVFSFEFSIFLNAPGYTFSTGNVSHGDYAATASTRGLVRPERRGPNPRSCHHHHRRIAD